MARPTVLVVDRQDARRKELVRGLASFAYEAIAAADAEEGRRFAVGLSPTVIVVEDALKDAISEAVGSETPDSSTPTTSLVVVLSGEEADETEAAEGTYSISAGALTSQAVLRKLRTLLVAQETGLGTDQRLESVVGDLEQLPLLELLPLLQRAVVTGRVLLREGELALSEGEVVATRVGGARGVKGFARVVRTAGGTFRVLLGNHGLEREVHEDFLSLMALAMEDQHRFEAARGKLPDFASRLRLVMGPAFFATHFSPSQQKLLEGAHSSRTIWQVLDDSTAQDGETLDGLASLVNLGFLEFDEPVVHVRIVTDSTCDLPAEVARRNQIHVVPLTVIFGDSLFKDGIDLNPGSFYKMLESRKEAHPRTSPPSKGEFAASFRDLARRSDLLSLHISEKMSQTLVHARLALEESRQELEELHEGGHFESAVVDSRQVSTGLGLLVLLASRLARAGVSVEEIGRRIESMAGRTHLLFLVDTLEYLARGGRIGRARALLGGLLGIKPILGLQDGEVTPIDRVRGGKAAHPRMVELFRERVDAAKPVFAGIGHASAPIWAERLRQLLVENFKIVELLETEIGPVVGAHVGPGCVGAVMFQPTEEELALLAPPATPDQ